MVGGLGACVTRSKADLDGLVQDKHERALLANVISPQVPTLTQPHRTQHIYFTHVLSVCTATPTAATTPPTHPRIYAWRNLDT